MSSRSSLSRRQLFVSLALLLILGNYLVIQWHVANVSPLIPEWPVAVDLLFMLPLLYLLIFRPPLKKSLLALIVLLSLGVAVGSFLIPRDSKLLWLQLDKIRWAYLIALGCAQLALFALVVADISKGWASGDLEQTVHRSIEKRFGASPVTELLKADARVWLYLLNRQVRRLNFSGVPFYARNFDQNASSQQAFLILVTAEIPVAHLIIGLFSPTVALVITVLSVYGLLFLYSEYRATLMRPTTLEANHLHIRHGALGDLILDYADIIEVRAINQRPRRAPGRLRFVGMGNANTLLLLRDGATPATLLGPRSVKEIYIGIDDAGDFREQLKQRMIG